MYIPLDDGVGQAVVAVPGQVLHAQFSVLVQVQLEKSVYVYKCKCI